MSETSPLLQLHSEQDYTFASWVVMLDVMHNHISPHDIRDIDSSHKIKRHFMRICLSATVDHDKFVNLINESCGMDSPYMSAAYSAGLVAPISECSSDYVIRSTVERASAYLTGDKDDSEQAVIEALDPEIVLIRNFYMRHKYTSDAIETAKKDSDPFQLPKTIKRFQLDSAYYIGHYERERLENI